MKCFFIIKEHGYDNLPTYPIHILCILIIKFLLIYEIWFPFFMHKMNVGLTKDDRLLSAKILKISHDISTVELRP